MTYAHCDIRSKKHPNKQGENAYEEARKMIHQIVIVIRQPKENHYRLRYDMTTKTKKNKNKNITRS